MNDNAKIILEAYLKGTEHDSEWLLKQLGFPSVKSSALDELKNRAVMALIPIGGDKCVP